MDIVIAGGGVAGLEALLGLHEILGDRAQLTLISPEADFVYRPLAVAEPFAMGTAHRVPLERFAGETGAQLVAGAVTGVDDAAGRVRLEDGSWRSYDALLVAPGGHAVRGVEGATTWWPGGDSDIYGGLLRDIDEGYTTSLAIVIPPGAVWPLPAYELALMTAGEARGMGFDDVTVTIVTPERAPVVAFGPDAGRAVAEELEHGGVRLLTNAIAVPERDGMTLLPGGEHVAVDRIFAVPRILGPALQGLPADEEGFVRTGDDMRVEGAARTWAAGDAVLAPVKFGGLATHMARVAIAGIARIAGVTAPDPGEPVLEGRLLLGNRTRRLRGRGDDDAAPLWWPQGKVSGLYLPRWLTEHGVTPPLSDDPVPGEAVEVRRTLSEVRGDTDYLARLGREYRVADTALATLGRRMRDLGG